jgi:phospholipid transport system substrate-binding protein
MRNLIRSTARTGFVMALCFALALAFAASGERAAALPSGPQESIGNFYAILISTMKGGGMLGQSGRYAKLAPAVDRAFDVLYMTRLAIGPSWPSLAADQQTKLTEAFRHYITATYADRFDSYSGEQLQVTGEQSYNDDIIVQTRIVKSNGEATTLNYLMHENQGAWQIRDVYLDGTISQLAVQRSEFNSILRREGVDGLVMLLNRKVDLLGRGFAKS